MSANFQQQFLDYWRDAQQRAALFLDVLRQRGDQFIEHNSAGKPPVLVFEHELILDGRDFEPPVNYALLRIKPPAQHPTNPRAKPRSEEHTSELQSRGQLVCRLLLDQRHDM